MKTNKKKNISQTEIAVDEKIERAKRKSHGASTSESILSSELKNSEHGREQPGR